MKNSVTTFLGIACIFLTSVWVTFLIVDYEKKIENLECEIELLNTEIEVSKNYNDSISIQLNELKERYKLFETDPVREFIDIMNAIIEVESRGNDSAYAPGEDAAGAFQIRKVMVDDINRILKRNNSLYRYTYEDRWCRDKSSEMFEIYCDHYNLTNAEEIARCWNGGPRGINNPYTLPYWYKVQYELGIGDSYASR
tara:strand:- start:467 stop:1057 length:591 start_codon:yes stop_codon:yes gene_type:complete